MGFTHFLTGNSTKKNSRKQKESEDRKQTKGDRRQESEVRKQKIGNRVKMTILWSSVYGLLVVEIGLLLALLLSCISTAVWCGVVGRINTTIESGGQALIQY